MRREKKAGSDTAFATLELLLARRPLRLVRRERQKPHQQSKQNQGADQGKQSVERMKVKIGVSRVGMPRRQHKTSSAVGTDANGRSV